MLPRDYRLTHSADFGRAVRRGRRAGCRRLVVHVALSAQVSRDDTPRVGFVVSKAVGPAVTRNLVKRRLRHLMGERLAGLPPHAVVVVRALPPAGRSGFGELGEDLDRCLQTCLARHHGSTTDVAHEAGVS